MLDWYDFQQRVIALQFTGFFTIVAMADAGGVIRLAWFEPPRE